VLNGDARDADGVKYKGGKRRTKKHIGCRKTLILVFISFLLFPYTLHPIPYTLPQRGDIDRLVSLIEARYGRMRGLSADFEQTLNAPGTHERRERGRLILQRPRRMRWEYDSQPNKLFIVNGRDVWFYVPADREATHADASTVSDSRFPFLFLLGNTNLRREFRSIEFVEGSASSSDMRMLRLLPQRNNTGLRELFLEVFNDGRISKMKLLDEAGTVSEITLTNVRENTNAPAETFEFHPPSGVTVRRQTRG
jgi:outer membrane lipoprotein carrier protein